MSLGRSISATKTGALAVVCAETSRPAMPCRSVPKKTSVPNPNSGRGLQTTQCHFSQTRRLEGSLEVKKIEWPLVVPRQCVGLPPRR